MAINIYVYLLFIQQPANLETKWLVFKKNGPVFSKQKFVYIILPFSKFHGWTP